MKASFADESGNFEVYPNEGLDIHVLELAARQHIEAFMTSHNLKPDVVGIYRNDRRMGDEYIVIMCKCTDGSTVGIAFEKV